MEDSIAVKCSILNELYQLQDPSVLEYVTVGLSQISLWKSGTKRFLSRKRSATSASSPSCGHCWLIRTTTFERKRKMRLSRWAIETQSSLRSASYP